MNYARFIVILSLSLVHLNGCGYTTKSLLPEYIDTVYVQTFKNKIDITQLATAKQDYKLYVPLLEVDITNAIINRFLYDGRLGISRSGDADSILSGELLEYSKDPLRYDIDTEEIKEYRITLVVHIRFEDIATKNTIVDKKLIGDTTYFTAGSLAINESQAIDAAIDDLARRVVEEIVEAW